MADEPDSAEARPESSDPKPGPEAGDGNAPAATPIDHPLFLPGVLVALMLWFGYDGWLNDDPDMQEHLAFNRWGFAALSVLFAWFGYKGWTEFKEDQAKAKRERDRR